MKDTLTYSLFALISPGLFLAAFTVAAIMVICEEGLEAMDKAAAERLVEQKKLWAEIAARPKPVEKSRN